MFLRDFFPHVFPLSILQLLHRIYIFTNDETVMKLFSFFLVLTHPPLAF